MVEGEGSIFQPNSWSEHLQHISGSKNLIATIRLRFWDLGFWGLGFSA